MKGIMLLLAVKDHRDRIEVGYGLEPILPDGFEGSILRGIRPLLRQGAYGQAMMFAAASDGFSRSPRAKGVSLNPQRGRSVAPYACGPGIPLPFIIIGVVLLLLLLPWRRRRRRSLHRPDSR